VGRGAPRQSVVGGWIRRRLIADDIDYRAVEGAPDDHGPIHGKDALRVYLQDWLDTFDEFRSEPVELIDAGEGSVIAVTKISGRAKLSGVEADLTYAALYTIRDGKIVRGREYWSRDERPSKPPGCGSRPAARRKPAGGQSSRPSWTRPSPCGSRRSTRR
jgi:ketosteroid isomerase-like protein